MSRVLIDSSRGEAYLYAESDGFHFARPMSHDDLSTIISQATTALTALETTNDSKDGE